MSESRKRRASWLVLLSLLLLPTLWACEMPSTGGSASTATATSSSEAEKTRKMEEKAAEIRRKEEEIRNMQGTEQEKIDAVNALEKERQELIDMQDDSGTN
jgi:TolA-binding protein